MGIDENAELFSEFTINTAAVKISIEIELW
jgi:hypothetical protein